MIYKSTKISTYEVSCGLSNWLAVYSLQEEERLKAQE